MSRISRELLILLAWVGAGATIVVVVGLIVVPAIWTMASAPQPTPVGVQPPLAIGSPAGPTVCTAAGAPTAGCLSAGDYVYQVAIETSNVEFSQVYLRILTSAGANYSATSDGGFSILNGTRQIVAAYNQSGLGALSMANPSQWVYFTPGTGVSSGSPFSTLDSIVVDMGTVNPAGRGYGLVAYVTGSEPGATAQLTLP